jgi:type VI secretion system protein VasG
MEKNGPGWIIQTIRPSAELVKLTARWQEEKVLVGRLLELRALLRTGSQPVGTTNSIATTSIDNCANGLNDAENSTTAVAATSVAATASTSGVDRATLLAELHTLQAKIASLQGESPLILASVDEQVVASIAPANGLKPSANKCSRPIAKGPTRATPSTP